MNSAKIIGIVCAYCECPLELSDNPTTGFKDTWREIDTGDPNCIKNEVGNLPIRIDAYYAVSVTGLHSPIPVYDKENK